MDVREKLVELVDKARRYAANKCHSFMSCAECDHYGEHDGNCRNTYIAESLIADGVTVQEWIPVTERLPEECPHPYDDMTKAVLIYTPVDGYTHIGWYAGKDYRGRDEWKTLSAMRSYQTCTKKVSHWCYLPQPPKGE